MSAAAQPQRSAYAAFCSGLLFPLQETLKGHTTVEVRKRLEETQWWPTARITSSMPTGGI